MQKASCKTTDFQNAANMRPADYGRSFVIAAGAAHGNGPMFRVESRCRIIDHAARVVRDYFQCASCKSENTFVEQDLFLTPNYDFLPVFAEDHAVIFRRYADVRPELRPYRSVGPLPWGPIRPVIRHAHAHVLKNGVEIVKAVAAAQPLIGQVEFHDKAARRGAILEFPIKTMNSGTDGKSWQVDTGPIVLPDLKALPEQWAQALRLAFVAYNAEDWADFVIEAQTPVGGGARERAMVWHYSEILHLATSNRVFAEMVE